MKKLDEAVELGMMQEWRHPWNGDTVSIPTTKFLMACGRTRAEANNQLAKMIEKLRRDGFKRVRSKV